MVGQRASSRLLPWAGVGFGFLVLALSYSGRATLGLVMPTVEQDMGWSRTFLSGSAAASLIVMAVLAPLAGYLINRLAKSLKRANRRAMEELSHIYDNLSETFGGIKVIKAFTTEQYERQRFHETAKEY